MSDGAPTPFGKSHIRCFISLHRSPGGVVAAVFEGAQQLGGHGPEVRSAIFEDQPDDTAHDGGAP